MIREDQHVYCPACKRHVGKFALQILVGKPLVCPACKLQFQLSAVKYQEVEGEPIVNYETRGTLTNLGVMRDDPAIRIVHGATPEKSGGGEDEESTA